MERLLDNKGETMAEAKSKSKSKPQSKESTKYKVTKDNGKVIFKDKEFVGNTKLERFKAKGWKVEEV